MPHNGYANLLSHPETYSRLSDKVITSLANFVTNRTKGPYITPSPSAPSLNNTRHAKYKLDLEDIDEREQEVAATNDTPSPVDAVPFTPCPSQSPCKRRSRSTGRPPAKSSTRYENGNSINAPKTPTDSGKRNSNDKLPEKAASGSAVSPSFRLETSATSRIPLPNKRNSDIIWDNSPTKRQRWGLFGQDLLIQRPPESPIVLDDDATTRRPNRQRKILSTLIDTIIPQDLDTLEPGKWLNNHVVDLYISYMVEKKLGIANRAWYFNTAFYGRLNRDLKEGQIINYKAVRGYTRHDNLFKYDYLVVPIIEENHWYVAIIWDLPALETVQDGNK